MIKNIRLRLLKINDEYTKEIELFYKIRDHN
jgi:hypothetical protein